jgi:hypothetical protein
MRTFMRITASPPAAQVEEVKRELKRGKPDFDGTLIPNVEPDEVVEARPPSRSYRLKKSVSGLPGTYSAARLGPPHPRAHRNPANLLRTHRRHIDLRIQGAVSLRRFAGTELKMQGGLPTDSGGHFEGRVGQRKA